MKVVRDESISYADNEKVLLIKLHSSAEQQDTIVVTGDDYYDVFARLPQVANLVKGYFATEMLLFLVRLAARTSNCCTQRSNSTWASTNGEHSCPAQPHAADGQYSEQKNVQVIAADVPTFLDRSESK